MLQLRLLLPLLLLLFLEQCKCFNSFLLKGSAYFPGFRFFSKTSVDFLSSCAWVGVCMCVCVCGWVGVGEVVFSLLSVSTTVHPSQWLLMSAVPRRAVCPSDNPSAFRSLLRFVLPVSRPVCAKVLTVADFSRTAPSMTILIPPYYPRRDARPGARREHNGQLN